MKLPLLLVVATSAAACGGQQHPLRRTGADNLAGREVVLKIRKADPFLDASVGQQLGMVGVLAMSLAGDRLLRDNAITDPARFIAQELGSHLKHRFGVSIAASHAAATPEPSADLVLEVWTSGWSLGPFPRPFIRTTTKHRLTYTARVRFIDAKIDRLIDGKRGFTIAEGTCGYSPKETPVVTTHDDFLADGAQRLKHELGVAASFCIDEFRSKVLTVSPAP